MEAAEARVKRAKENSAEVFSLGYAPSLVAPWLPKILTSLNSQLPNTKVQLCDVDNEAMIAGIRDRTIDAGILPDQAVPSSDFFDSQHLVAIGYEVVLPANHPLTSKKKIQIRDLGPECLIAYDRKQYPDYFDSLRRIYAAVSRPLILGLEVDSGTSLLAMVRGGQGVAIVSTTVQKYELEGLAFRPLDPSPEGFHLSFVTHRDIPVRHVTLVREALQKVFT